MDKEQESYSLMFDSVIGVCAAHESEWSANTLFANAYQTFTSLHATLLDAQSKQSISSVGASADKLNVRKGLEELVLTFSDALVAYGKLTPNQEIVGKEAKTTASAVSKMSDDKIRGFANDLLILTDKLGATAKTNYGLTADKITALTNKIVEFSEYKRTVRHQLESSQTGTKELDKLIRDLRSMLDNQVDAAAALLRNTLPSFYSEYIGAREIVDPSYNTRALTVNITETGSNQPIPSVTATINPGNQVKESGAAGVFYIKSLAGGTYTMVLSKAGYETKQQTINIIDNEHTVVNVQLVSNGANENPPPGGGA